jgi:hypothetical protein
VEQLIQEMVVVVVDKLLVEEPMVDLVAQGLLSLDILAHKSEVEAIP